MPKATAPEIITQADPTRPRPIDADGRTLDAWGLPVNGPARLAALDGKPDPALSGEAPPAPAEPDTAPATPAPDAPAQQD